MTAGVILALTLGIAGPVPKAVQEPVPASGANAAVVAQHRRDQIAVMEGVLAAAVRNGAGQAVRALQSNAPGPMLFSSMPRARGFFLDGYGVFFNVEIPMLRPSAVWSMQTMERDLQVTATALDSLRALADSVPDPTAKKQYQAAVKRLELQIGVPPSQQRSNAGGIATAASETVTLQPEEKDPNEQYTTAVIAACMDAMIEHSKPMDLKPDEWLTVALSASEGPLVPGEISDRETIVLRIRGSDLTDYLAGRTTRDEIRKKVDVRMF